MILKLNWGLCKKFLTTFIVWQKKIDTDKMSVVGISSQLALCLVSRMASLIWGADSPRCCRNCSVTFNNDICFPDWFCNIPVITVSSCLLFLLVLLYRTLLFCTARDQTVFLSHTICWAIASEDFNFIQCTDLVVYPMACQNMLGRVWFAANSKSFWKCCFQRTLSDPCIIAEINQNSITFPPFQEWEGATIQMELCSMLFLEKLR